MASGRLVLLSALLRSLLNDRRAAAKIGAITGFSGFTAGHRWWGWMSAALWISWRMPATCWRLGEGFWVVKLDFGGLRMEFAGVVVSGRKKA